MTGVAALAQDRGEKDDLLLIFQQSELYGLFLYH